MNCRNLAFLLPMVLLINGCHNTQQADIADVPQWIPPPAGTVVAADSMKLADELNNSYFAVKLVASPANDKPGTMGYVYDLYVHCGANEGMQQITMPKGGRNLKPLIRRAANDRTTYIVGFIPGRDFGGDTTFLEYYSVSEDGRNIKVKALKSYTFQ